MAESGSSSINATGNDRPSLKDLYDHVVNDAADKWKELGVQLLRSDQEIAVDHPGDAVSCCKRVLEKWLDTTTDATWNQLITALRSPSVQLNNLASQLEQKLSKESMAEKKFNALSVVMELGKKLDPEGDIRPMADDDAGFAYDKLYELAAREMDPQKAKALTEGLIETVFRITIRYRDKQFNLQELMEGFELKVKGRDLFLQITSFHEGTALYDEDKGNLVSTTKRVVELMYKLVDEDFREARKLDDVLTFLTREDILGKLFKPDGCHRDILSSFVEVFSKISEGEIFSFLI